jgi:predicted RNase H-like nuclease (RuvC/YqgF family)
MSDLAAPESAFRELDQLVRHLADELAGFRRRALVAEARIKEIEASEGGAASLELAQRIAHLEKENDRLESRLQAATTRAKQMLDRVRFLRQQAQAGSGGTPASGVGVKGGSSGARVR